MRSTPLVRPVALVALVAMLWMVDPAAAAPPPAVTDLQPRSVQPGAADVELVIRGKDLAGVTEVAIPNGAGIEAKVAGEPSASEVKVSLTVAKDAVAGFRELRLIGKGGVSAPLRLRISPHPHRAEKEPSSTQQPQRVELPALIAGTLNEAGDRDVFRFDANKGQTLVFNVHGERLSPRIDPVITLYDSRGHELAANDNHHGMDPLLVYEVPADGAYTLELRDLEYRGGAAFDYQIEAGQIPYLHGLFPPIAQQGHSQELAVLGLNLGGEARVQRDLAHPGVQQVEVSTAGATTKLQIDIVDVPVAQDVESNDVAGQAQAIPMPGAVAGRIDREGDVDRFKFSVSAKQRYDLHVLARELGSPMDAVLTLMRDGKLIERNDDGGDGFDARIVRELEPGDYVASVTDLTRSGGPAYTYGLSLTAATEPRQDFTVRFLPDTVRVHRGGQTQMWAEVKREGYKGDVTLKLLDAPPGVTIEPATLSAETSGVFTIAAADDAPLGTTPLRIEITGKVGRKAITHVGEPEHEQRLVEQAYVTVLEAAPFTVLPLATADRQGRPRDNPYRQIARLERRLERATPELEAQQREWESHAAADAVWNVLKFDAISATGGAKLEPQADGAILAGGENPNQSTYTLTTAPVAPGDSIAALRLEALPDDSLPAKGPGRAANGNFVLSHLKVTAAPKDQPDQAAEVKLTDPRADFSQANWPIANALDSNPANGWATMPRFGQPNTATFKLAEPIAAGSIVTITLAHASPHVQHTLGRFRLSVSADADAADQEAIPADVLAIVRIPANKRTPEEATKLATYYRTVAPSLSPVREQLAKLRKDAPAFPPVTSKKDKTTLQVLIQRAEGFEGDVKVSLEGFVTGRGGNGQPADIGQSLDVKPITLKGKDTRGTLTISAKNTSQTGTRMVILRAESKVDGETIINDSKPFPLTVNN